MDSTDDGINPLLSVTGIGKTEAEPVLADATLSQRARVAPARTIRIDREPYAPASCRQSNALSARMAMHVLDLRPTVPVAENPYVRHRQYKEGSDLVWAGPTGRRGKTSRRELGLWRRSRM